MNREAMLERLRRERAPWDVVVIGGGATGLGCAVDAASRGLRTALFERGDFAQATSSRSTKLVHGGVRYLRHGNIHLVRESLHERALLLRNAPALVTPLAFVVPAYHFGERAFYRIGLGLYDMIAGKNVIAGTRALSTRETIDMIPTVASDGLRGGVVYHDASFDDARMALALAGTAVAHGAVVVNYVGVTGILKTGTQVAGVGVRVGESGETLEINAKAVINATGVFSDRIREMDDAAAAPMIRPSRGTHIVLDRSFLPGATALMVPHTDDGRVLFAIPWHGSVVVGTTETSVEDPAESPRASAHEVDFLVSHAARYLSVAPTHDDVRSVFAGLRPLLGAASGGTLSAALSRDHRVMTSRSGLVTIAGGKWTTYRRMAADAVDRALSVAEIAAVPTRSATLTIDPPPLVSELTADIVSALAHTQMALTVEDILARRSRLLFTDARAALSVAPAIASHLASALGQDTDWQERQVASFTAVARAHLPSAALS